MKKILIIRCIANGLILAGALTCFVYDLNKLGFLGLGLLGAFLYNLTVT